MNRKGWVTPIFVFIIFMAFLFYYEPHQTGASLAQMSTDDPIPWHETPATVTQIKVHNNTREVIATLIEDTWYLDHTENMLADPTYIYTILSSFQAPHLLSTVQMGGVEPEVYGIDKFSTTITLYDADGVEYTLIKGKETNTSSVFVYSPQLDTVYTMHQEHFAPLSFNLDIWRDKNFVYFDAENTSKITVATNNRVHTLLKDDESPVGFSCTTLDDDIISDLIYILRNARINTFIVDHADQSLQATYGLDMPDLTLTIYDDVKGINSFSLSYASNTTPLCYVLMHDTNNIYTTAILSK